MNIASSAWGQATYPFKKNYLDILAGDYTAGLQLVDFIRSSELAIAQINQWVAEQTAGRIKELVTSDEITQDTRLVLANATYFKASWQFPFSEALTQPEPFHLLNGDAVTVEMMHAMVRMPYMRADYYQAVRLPYVGKTTEMLIILPDVDKFVEVEQALNPVFFEKITAQIELHDVELAMPKFSLDSKLDLVKTLKTLGLQIPFDPRQADFSGSDNLQGASKRKVLNPKICISVKTSS